TVGRFAASTTSPSSTIQGDVMTNHTAEKPRSLKHYRRCAWEVGVWLFFSLILVVYFAELNFGPHHTHGLLSWMSSGLMVVSLASSISALHNLIKNSCKIALLELRDE